LIDCFYTVKRWARCLHRYMANGKNKKTKDSDASLLDPLYQLDTDADMVDGW